MDILQKIMQQKAQEVAIRRGQVSEAALLQRVKYAPPTQGFAHALLSRAQQGQNGVIAEVKRGSPSKGRIYPEHLAWQPAQIAESYRANGAACISCLTDETFFMGHDAFLQAIRAAVACPVLRKDFLYHSYQVVEARSLGADAILLIMAVLETPQAQELEAAARELGMDVLVEVHDERELEQAHELKTPLMGVNNRNLKTFVTDIETSFRLAARMEKGRLAISESGLNTPEDLARLNEAGIFSFLIGESLMRGGEPGGALAQLLGREVV
ncbi:indole-3-glycerol phosphate synthase [Magnetococcus marinus MC-1]|uniref:Indole-3-glycerol phosphate synthase n=1 Tax=Magnetococcus marinus (strain ATCC BAA-1437 / JCM 17883 / MC-1) TaxID=156889 RepID=TRPC_MAGMM|nr:indole-3-glycerol phosphate synthase TrpC [Magnetococcus marinus]A0LA39.1 RecName: Full=Indole-3-glycerol phosphate synthase; Short=IGPS [Magnetococcus marinus MC-1]ABK44832.1 indole-3-glycerol phosphate synthase [Magnetococcus marinus MC-1]